MNFSHIQHARHIQPYTCTLLNFLSFAKLWLIYHKLVNKYFKVLNNGAICLPALNGCTLTHNIPCLCCNNRAIIIMFDCALPLLHKKNDQKIENEGIVLELTQLRQKWKWWVMPQMMNPKLDCVFNREEEEHNPKSWERTTLFLSVRILSESFHSVIDEINKHFSL